MRSHRLLIFVLLTSIVFFGTSNSFSFDYMVNDFTFYPIPSTPRPPKGIPYTDPVYKTEIVRITDAPTDVPGRSTNYAQPGYPKHDNENADGTMLMIQSYRQPLFHIWNANSPYNKIKDFPSMVGAATDPDPRWDATDPNVLYFTATANLSKWNVKTNELTVLHDFRPDFPEVPVSLVTTREEGTPSADTRYWAFIIRNYSATHSPTWWNSHYVVYDKDFFGKDNGKIISVLKEGDPYWSTADAITMSPSGKYVVLSDSLVRYTRDFSRMVKLPGCCSHFDFAYDDEGREVIVDALQYYGPDGRTNMGRWARMVDLETAQVFWLAPVGGGQHVSANCYDKPGWALFSMMTPFYPTPVTEWFHHGVFMVELTRKYPRADLTNHSKVWRLATANNLRKGYSDDPYGKINKRGTKVWFGSAWGQSSSDPGAQYDVYQINLPSTWYQDLKGSNSMILMTHSLPEVIIGSSYSQTLQIIGGASPYTWSITSGTLPNGLLLNPSTGVISGTPTTQGTFSFTVQVRDSTPQTTAINLSIKIRSSDTTPPAVPTGVKIVK
jgi:hypothetical protein